MKKLVTGVERFRSQVYDEQRDFYEQLGRGQTPHSLFITCSDSRIDPNRMTQSEVGELFIIRNAGNIVPAWGADTTAEAATIEFALAGLGIEHIVVCGHTDCGAMKALIADEPPSGMPAMAEWLSHADATRRIVRECYGDRGHDEQLSVAIQENVLAQLTNLRTHPAVAARLAAGRLHLHAWVYKITTGEVFAHDARDGQFKPLPESEPEEAEPARAE